MFRVNLGELPEIIAIHCERTRRRRGPSGAKPALLFAGRLFRRCGCVFADLVLGVLEVRPFALLCRLQPHRAPHAGQTHEHKHNHRQNPHIPHSNTQARDSSPQFASGSGRSWKCSTLLVVPLPVSVWNIVRVAYVDHNPLPFQPAFGSSILPSSPLAK